MLNREAIAIKMSVDSLGSSGALQVPPNGLAPGVGRMSPPALKEALNEAPQCPPSEEKRFVGFIKTSCSSYKFIS